MKNIKTLAASMSVLVALAGCAGTPMGPRVQVLPAANKPFEVFQAEQAGCQQFAADKVAPEAEAANNKAVGTTVLGAILGTALGAAAGGGRGGAIAVGAAAGGVMGTAIGSGESQKEQLSIQQQYDNAYAQCMYARGNQVVAPSVRVIERPVVVYSAPPPPVYYVAPPTAYPAPPATTYYAPPPPTSYAPPPPTSYAPPPDAVAAPPGLAPPAP
jgi:uncharacterized protein YcfJ